MTTSSKILCDADFIIALFITTDSNHQKACDLYDTYDFEQFFVMNITMYEVATVLSRLLPQSEAVTALQLVRQRFDNPVIFETKWGESVYELYNTFQKKNISFFDCACMILAKKVKAKIASFDSFYPPELLV